jgi:hypothetical protein
MTAQPAAFLVPSIGSIDATIGPRVARPDRLADAMQATFQSLKQNTPISLLFSLRLASTGNGD